MAHRDEGVPPALWGLVGVMAAIEFALWLSDSGVLGQDLRMTALIYGAFWPQLLEGTLIGAYPGQTAAMFVTHAFLHGGFLHLAMNAVVLLALGKAVTEQAGTVALMLVFLISAIGGGAGFALLSDGEAPMIGASGAVFGFIGLWQYGEARLRLARRMSLRPVLGTCLGLILANVVIAVMLQGALAWEAHLGGFLAGAALGPLVTRLVQARQRPV
ncbi:rhomboid family intramembrane serine protease [Plastorhodobacter daqingensis]|uniref:Rhomboid family intramembrane serine protease n=1 Tax=Plastorhodobacter daqingensis TaxID=1387281 RepID=A0ABW2UJV2_9RHOB